jgi:hypothetical protein
MQVTHKRRRCKGTNIHPIYTISSELHTLPSTTNILTNAGSTNGAGVEAPVFTQFIPSAVRQTSDCMMPL